MSFLRSILGCLLLVGCANGEKLSVDGQGVAGFGGLPGFPAYGGTLGAGGGVAGFPSSGGSTPSAGGSSPGSGGDTASGGLSGAGGTAAGGSEPGSGGAGTGGVSAGGAGSGGVAAGGAGAGGAGAGGAGAGGAGAGGVGAGGVGAGGVGAGGAGAGGIGSGGVGAGGAGAGGAGAGGIGSGGVGAGGVGAGGTPACGDNLLPVPDDPSARGPWDVGVRTVTIGRLTVEVIYPAEPGSTAGVPEATYDVRDWLPASERTKVPDSHVPAVSPIGGHLYRGVPIDGAHGPYPVVVFIHGTASFRIASASVNVNWASRGFVVVMADYPGMFLADILCTTPGCTCTATGAQDVPGDVTTQIQALTNPTGSLAFLAGHIDMNRLGISGHSQGGCITANLTSDPHVQIAIPMSASFPVQPSSSLKSLMFIGGVGDTVIGYSASLVGNWVCPIGSTSDTGAYQASPGPPSVTKRLVGITGGGHLVPTDLCQTNAQGLNAIQEANADGVCGVNNAVLIGLPALFDCGSISMADGIKAVSYASTAALEETLQCKDRSAAFSSLQKNVPIVGDFQHAP